LFTLSSIFRALDAISRHSPLPPLVFSNLQSCKDNSWNG